MLGCRPRRSHEVSTIPKTSDDEQTQTTPKYATVILSTNGRNDLDTEESTISHLLLTLTFVNSKTFQGKIRNVIVLLYFPYILFTYSFHFFSNFPGLGDSPEFSLWGRAPTPP